MFYQQLVKKAWAIAFSLVSCSLPIFLAAAATWSPIPPAPIPGAGATNVGEYFSTVVTTYNPNNQTILATWLDINYIPTYAVWGGSSWITPATNIPGASALSSFNVPIYNICDPVHNTIVTTWTDASNNPVYTIWNGSSWTTPAIIPGGSTANYSSVYTTYDAANHTVVATWGDQSSNPVYAVLSGNEWTTPATTIPGTNSAATVILSTYNAANQTVIATWVNSDDLPTYALWNGSSWVVPSTLIPNAGTVSGVVVVAPTYDPGNQTVIVTWIEYIDSTFLPTYAVLTDTTWVVTATPISTDTTGDAMLFSTYNAANQTVMTTWLDDASTLMYALWNGSSWTSPAPVPGSIANSYLLLQPVYDPGSQTFIATWLGLGTFGMEITYTPAYAVWDGSSWTIPTTAIPGASPFVAAGYAPFLYSTYSGSNQTIMVTWLDTNGIPTYALYTNSVASATNFSGYVTTTRYLTQTDRVNNLVWTPSSDPLITGYELRRNGIQIYNAPANGPYRYADHNRSKKGTDVYTLISQGQNGLQSLPLTVVIQ